MQPASSNIEQLHLGAMRPISGLIPEQYLGTGRCLLDMQVIIKRQGGMIEDLRPGALPMTPLFLNSVTNTTCIFHYRPALFWDPGV